jgi:uncharacterized OsmC-like protein
MGTMRVRHVHGDRFEIDVRGHVIAVDQPIVDGGTDTAPTPTELFVAGLTSCVAFYARRYLARHDLPDEGLTVTGRFEMAAKPARVADIDIEITLPEAVPSDRREALLAVASHCTVHNSLTHRPHVRVGFADAAADETRATA